MVRLKVGHEQAKSAQDYSNLASVVSQALGGKGPTGGSAPPPLKNTAEAKQAFAGIFGVKSVR